MNIKPKIYALAMVDAFISAKQSEIKILKNVVAIMKKNGDTRKVSSIIRLAERLFYEKTGKRKIVIEMAREGSHIPKSLAKKGDIVQRIIKKELVAGVRIIVNHERQLDYSLIKNINEVFNIENV